jgi:uncharacterized protein YndB with AHSA1/START domain
VIAAPPPQVWEVVADPHHLARWWPLATRVEDVREAAGNAPARWTLVLQSSRGASVRADFRRTACVPGERLAWEQELRDSPFARILKQASTDVEARAAGEETAVTLTSRERLRGLSRLGALMMRRAARARLDEALRNLDRVITGADRE